jgi:hypothetical protein
MQPSATRPILERISYGLGQRYHYLMKSPWAWETLSSFWCNLAIVPKTRQSLDHVTKQGGGDMQLRNVQSYFKSHWCSCCNTFLVACYHVVQPSKIFVWEHKLTMELRRRQLTLFLGISTLDISSTYSTTIIPDVDNSAPRCVSI